MASIKGAHADGKWWRINFSFLLKAPLNMGCNRYLSLVDIEINGGPAPVQRSLQRKG
jgi:hypothetical protein